ncbi:hypothetical protein [Brevibacillus laterosporus]|uniref:hypothetical protein n=1 Tax=Brevibacillus laterosporus TaxID=1465 RepID=UPI003D1CB874
MEGFIDFLERKLTWILIVLVVVGLISLADYEFSQLMSYNKAKLDEVQSRLEKKIDDRNLAITDHFKTSEWVLQDSVSTGERGAYLLSTKDGNYIITLNPEGNKVIKSVKQGG